MSELKISDPITEKYKIWDVELVNWFRPIYPRGKETRTREILFSQSGEMFLHENDGKGGQFTITHIPPGENAKFIPCLYTGVKDNLDVKVYHNDIISGQHGEGLVISKSGCWMIKWAWRPEPEPLGFTQEGRLRSFEVVENLLENQNHNRGQGSEHIKP